MSQEYQYTSDSYPAFREGDHALEYTLRVTLKHIKPSIYRKFVVPSNITLRHLADLIIELMGWSGAHLNAYHINGKNYHPAYQMTQEYGYYGGVYDNDRRQEDYTIADVLSQKGKAVELEYDFGDGWSHEIRLSSISEYLDDEPHRIYFLKGERACPLEDIGGQWGYMDLIGIVEKKRARKRLTKEEKELLELMDIEPMLYNPEYFDSKECDYICMKFGDPDKSFMMAVKNMVEELSEILAINHPRSC